MRLSKYIWNVLSYNNYYQWASAAQKIILTMFFSLRKQPSFSALGPSSVLQNTRVGSEEGRLLSQAGGFSIVQQLKKKLGNSLFQVFLPSYHKNKHKAFF